jgi:hypothetical protein
MKNITFKALIVVAVGMMAYFHFFTPSAWHWRGNNLQVRLFHLEPDRVDHARFPSNWEAHGFGWSKGDIFTLGWGRIGYGRAGEANFFETTARIAGVSRGGVSIRLVHHETRAGTNGLAFEKTIFVPATVPVRVDISDRCYLTGEFVQNND